MEDNKETNIIIEKLILDGGLEIVGIDESGEPLYSFTPKLKILMPELYSEHLNSVNKEVMNLWEKGYVNIDLLSEDPIITMNEKSFIYEEILKLSKEEQWHLSEVKRLLGNKI